jgi:protein phosphatase
MQTTEATRVATAAATHPGLKRSGNEDSYAIWTPEAPGAAADTLLVVCDGMGGSNAGEVASRMTVDAFLRHFAEEPFDDPTEALANAAGMANTEVWQHTQTRPDLAGMGTTCTALLVRDDRVFVAHVGDSRAYLIRHGDLRQLTQDHSLVAQLVARKQLTPEEARHDPRRNVVTRCIGISPVVEADVVSLDEAARPGDTFLVCSDGLHGQVEPDELAKLASDGSIERACQRLIDLANERGGPDNITVLIARVEEPTTTPVRYTVTSRATTGASRKRRTLQWLIAALVALLIAVCGFAWVVFGMMRSGSSPASKTEAVGR